MKFIFALVFCLAWMGGASAQQPKIRPITDDCKHTESVSGGGYQLLFCRPETGALPQYLRMEKDVEGKNDNGDATLSDNYFQFGPHWELHVSVSRLKDGHPLDLDTTKQKVIDHWHANNEVLDVQTNVHNKCYGVGIFRGIMRNKDGNKVYVKAILHRTDMLLVSVTTYCKNGVCDPDTYGYPLLAHFAEGPAAADPKCGSLYDSALKWPNSLP